MKRPSRTFLLGIGVQFIIGGLIVHRAIKRIEYSYESEALRQKIYRSESNVQRYEQEYAALTSIHRIGEEARKRGFIIAPLAAYQKAPQTDSLCNHE